MFIAPAMQLASLLLLQTAPATDAANAPIDFRCDSMQLFAKPGQVICRRNVVVRRADLIVCCDTFEGYTDDAGGWQRFACSDGVRAQRHDEVMWAEKATFVVRLSDLILTGNPRIQRGRSMLSGERIIVDTKHDRAHIEKPQGRMAATDTPARAAETMPLEGPLPARCPVARPPK